MAAEQHFAGNQSLHRAYQKHFASIVCRGVVCPYLKPHQPLKTSMTADETGERRDGRKFCLKVSDDTTTSCKHYESLETLDLNYREGKMKIKTG